MRRDRQFWTELGYPGEHVATTAIRPIWSTSFGRSYKRPVRARYGKPWTGTIPMTIGPAITFCGFPILAMQEALSVAEAAGHAGRDPIGESLTPVRGASELVED